MKLMGSITSPCSWSQQTTILRAVCTTMSTSKTFQNLHIIITTPTCSFSSHHLMRHNITLNTWPLESQSPLSSLVWTTQSTLRLPHVVGSDIMHLSALNLSDLMISLWHGMINCTLPDDWSTWTWAVLQCCNIWHDHSKAVTALLQVGQSRWLKANWCTVRVV